ncbi:hypothetical protein NIASO_17820 [Niabella soli DSM 19437]|uniref:Uncharacterized protein n=1 Tax=Niabella soli DSM 19437 TaxID=929713 RepID=W0F9B0_9BACT|nr:hypothetical protein NIASO_17820 [Niabella soli DSM 19437]
MNLSCVALFSVRFSAQLFLPDNTAIEMTDITIVKLIVKCHPGTTRYFAIGLIL